MRSKGIKVSFEAVGDRQLRRKLKRLAFKSIRRANREALRFGMTPVKKAIRKNVPVDEEDLKKATITKVVGSGLNIVGVAGADASYRVPIEGGGAADEKIPANYDHLVNDGHVNDDGTFTPPTGYIQKSEDAAAPEVAKRYERKFVQIIEKEVAKQ